MRKSLGLLLISGLFPVVLIASPVQTQLGQTQLVQTQLEQSNWTELTSYQHQMDYLSALAASSGHLNMKSIGKTSAGRDIPALFFSHDGAFAKNREKKPLLIIFSQQHGNEPSGKEAALIVARRLLHEDAALLNKLDLILVPQVNPDGSEAGKRRNANNMDLNRNHVMLSEPESNALHQLFLDWMPEITLDVHEYNAVLSDWIDNGYIKDADEMLGGVTNLNIDADIINFSRDIFIPETGKGIEQDGFRFHRYIVGSPFDDGVVRYSTTAINDGRHSFGIYNTLSFIIEGKRYGNLMNEIEKRTRGQVSAILNFLKTSSRHSEKVLEIVNQARTNMSRQNTAFIQMEYYSDKNQPTLNFPVFDLKTWTRSERELTNFKPTVKVKKSVEKPAAYYIEASHEKLIKLLKKHRFTMLKLSKAQTAKTETYHIKHVSDGIDEEKHTYLIDLEKTTQNETLKAGSVVVPVNGNASNLIPLILEPESSWGIVATRSAGNVRFDEYLTPGHSYPIKRLVSVDHLQTEPFSN